MEKQLYDEAVRAEILSKKLVRELKEGLEYSSLSFVNNAVEVLRVFKKRIIRGDKIVNEADGKELGLKSFREFVKENFSSYIAGETFAEEEKHSREKVYFTLEACEGGYNLILAEDGNSKTYEWISSLSERFSLVRMIATGVVYIKDNRSDVYAPFISGNGKYCRYDEENGRVVEI